jgi:NADPH:quinone reductase-like Zn-dependent oxidoreductase
MAGQTVSKRNLCIGLPADLDDLRAAAVANPGMSSWAALTLRAKLVSGESVLINGATGSAGRMAIRIAKHLGAKTVIATGRDAASIEDLPLLGADATIALDQAPEKLTAAFRAQIRDRGVNVILDYLWGPSVERMLEAMTGHGEGTAEPRIRFVQIGSVAGPSIPFPASALRSSGIELMGSGLGSVSHEGLIQAIGAMMNAVVPAKLTIDVEAIPLSQVEDAWNRTTAKRVVFKI